MDSASEIHQVISLATSGKSTLVGVGKKERYVFIDALRGIAALGVLLHHLLHNSVMEITLRKTLPAFFTAAMSFGAMGVQVFFVISGFVIAHSLRDTVPTWKSAGIFALKRQLRLDPPYWVAVFITLLLWWVEASIPKLVTPAPPSAGVVIANLVYLQNILHQTQMMSVAWTLCLEVQFYVFFFLVLGMIFAFSGKSLRLLPGISSIFIALSGIVSLCLPFSLKSSAWFPAYWLYFAGGVLCYWTFSKKAPAIVFAFFLSFLLIGSIYRREEELYTGIVTIALIYVLGRLGRLTKWSCGGALQYFGKISYSLYLIHLVVAALILRIGYKITGENGGAAIVWVLFAAGASILAAHLLNRFVERPTLRLSSKISIK